MSTQVTLNLIAKDEDGETCTEEHLCEIDYTSHKAYRGYRNSMGVPEEPDEPAGFEIESITDETGREIPFKEIEGGEETVIEKLEKHFQ